MKLLTEKQKEWLSTRTVNVNETYMFPTFGFHIFAEPSYLGQSEFLDTNPFTRSLAHERFLVKEKVNGFCRGNFEHKPKGADVYIPEHELAHRDLIERVALYLTCFIPFVVYNLFSSK